MMKKTFADSKIKGKNLDSHATYMVNSRQGKIAGVYSDYTTQFINTLALDMIHVLDNRSYFLSC